MTISATTGTSEHDDPPVVADDRHSGAARRYGLLALVLTLVAGLVLGYAGGWLTPRLARPGDTSAEAGFARDMTSHHAQAVEMGLIAFQSSGDPDVRSLGADIATGQQGEIGMMQAWLRSWGLNPTGSDPAMAWVQGGTSMVRDGLMPGMATKAEMDRLRAARGYEFDLFFLDLMTRHHLGGIHMIDAILDESDNEYVVEAATKMKNTQQNDLANIRSLRTRLGG